MRKIPHPQDFHPTAPQKTTPNSSLPRQLRALYLTTSINAPSHWSTLVKHYYSHGRFKEALLIYTRNLPLRTHHPLLPLVLKSCALLSLLPLGRSLHAESIKSGQISDVRVETSLVSMYCKCRHLVDGRDVFDEMRERNVVTYNAMISGYVDSGDVVSALALFGQMRELTPVSWVLMIEGLARSGDVVGARQLFDRMPGVMRNVATWSAMVHAYTVNGEMDYAVKMFHEMPCRNSFVWSSMVSGYFKEGRIEEARAMFDRNLTRNLVNWNALITGYTQNGLAEAAIEAFEEMMKDGFEPDEVTAASILSACAQLGSLYHGKRIHELIKQRRIEINQFVLSGLVDMYAKCGDLETAERIFEGMRQRNEVCWNSMISGFSSHGQCKDALKLFERMEASDEKPDEVTFLAVLSACAHGGLLNEAFEIFYKMEKYGYAAGVAHYGCLVDLLGRAGRMDEAYDLIQQMPIKPNETVWGSFLGACRIHSNAKMAERAVKKFSEDGADDAQYLLLSNIYAAQERWEDAERLRKKMAEDGIRKIPGCSSIVLGSTEHQFHSGDSAEPLVCQL